MSQLLLTDPNAIREIDSYPYEKVAILVGAVTTVAGIGSMYAIDNFVLTFRSFAFGLSAGGLVTMLGMVATGLIKGWQRLGAPGFWEVEMRTAPAEAATAMRRALAAAHTIEAASADLDEWLTPSDLRDALWDLAQCVRNTKVLREALDGGTADLVDADKIRAELDDAIAYLRDGADRLAAVADRITALTRAQAEAAASREADERAHRAAGTLGRARVELYAATGAAAAVADRLEAGLDAHAALPAAPAGTSATATK